MDKNIVYALCEPDTGAVRYVGKSSSGLRRPRDHGRSSVLSRNRTYLTNWIKSLHARGDNYLVQVLETHQSNLTLSDAERRWIAYGRANGWRLTNLTDGGDGAPGFNPSPETREKLRRVMIGNKFALGHTHKTSDETRRKISIAHKGRTHGLGSKRTEETRAKMSAGQKARYALRPVSEETIAKMSVAKLGTKVNQSPELRAKRVAAMLGNKYVAGRVQTVEERARRAASSTGRLHSETSKAKMREAALRRYHPSPELSAGNS